VFYTVRSLADTEHVKVVISQGQII